MIVALLALAMQQQAAQRPDTANALPYPGIVQERQRVTAGTDDAAIVQALEHKIRCTCGCGLDVFTCRTTDFTCQTSPAMHRQVMARLDSGLTADQVVAAFEAQYGQSILMQPPKRGFNWAAYLMPFVALVAGIVVVTWLMRRWIRGQADERTSAHADGPGPLARSSAGPSDDQLAKLNAELERFES